MSEPIAPLSESTLSRVRDLSESVVHEIQRVYLGPPRIPKLLLAALVAKGHVLLEGVPGVAKTTLAKTFAQVLGCGFQRIQFTPDLLPTDITGTHVLSPQDGSFGFRHGPVFSNIVLGDEINRAPAKTQSALLEAMQEQQVTADGETLPLPDPFMVIATQNPIEHSGTYPLPEAQLDRFLLHIVVSYPSEEQEIRMLRRFSGPRITPNGVLGEAEILRLQAMATQVHAEDELLRYIVNLTGSTRTHSDVFLGASPRASLALFFASRATALLSGRAYMTPDDVKSVAKEVLAHRIVMAPEASFDPSAPHGTTANRSEKIVERSLNTVSHRLLSHSAGPNALRPTESGGT